MLPSISGRWSHGVRHVGDLHAAIAACADGIVRGAARSSACKAQTGSSSTATRRSPRCHAGSTALRLTTQLFDSSAAFRCRAFASQADYCTVHHPRGSDSYYAMQLQAEKAKVAEYFRAGNYDLGMIRTESVRTCLCTCKLRDSRCHGITFNHFCMTHGARPCMRSSVA